MKPLQRLFDFGKDTLRDLRLACRQLLKHKGFTAVAVLSLALGIGANTSIFSLVNAVLLRSLPLPNPHELRLLKWSGTDPKWGNYTGSWNSAPNGRATGNAFSYPVFAELRREAGGLAEIIGYLPLNDVALRASHAPFVGRGSLVSDNYFSCLGVGARIGRLRLAEDNAAGAASVAVISHAMWRREFDGDPGAIGRLLQVNGHAFTVIGVLPEDFPGITPANPPDFYVPLSSRGALALDWSETAPNECWVQLMARLKPGISDARFRSLADVVLSREASSLMGSPGMIVEDGSGGPASERRLYRKPLFMLLGVVGIVLLIACANLAGMLLARGVARRHEFAVCAAIGASRWRLIRQSLSESAMLAVTGGALGVLIAVWGRTVLSRLLAGRADGLHYEASLDARVLGFTTATVFLTALLSGLLPALWSARVAPLSVLTGRSRSAGPKQRAGKLLVTAQIALTTLLVVGAILYSRTLVNLAHINPGFATENLVLFQLDPGAAGYDGAHRSRFYDQAQQALAAIPGVRSVALTQFKLLSSTMSGGEFFTLPGIPTEGAFKPSACRLTISETFFDTMNIPFLLGRGFRTADTAGATRVVVVNRAFATKYFPNGNAVGAPMKVGSDYWQIVGVCGDAKYFDLKAEPPPTVYFSFRQDPLGSGCFALRTPLPVAAVVKAAREAVLAVDPSIPVFSVTTQAQVRNQAFSQERLFALLCGALAVLAVLLSCIGLYGLTAYNVTRRRGEIGIRMALGATRRKIACLVLREALLLGGVGVAIGIPVALAVSQLIKNQLYGVAFDRSHHIHPGGCYLAGLCHRGGVDSGPSCSPRGTYGGSKK